MNHHLQKAKTALEKQARFGSRTGPKPEDLVEAIKEILDYLREQEERTAATVKASRSNSA
jgi:hypothetical protein